MNVLHRLRQWWDGAAKADFPPAPDYGRGHRIANLTQAPDGTMTPVPAIRPLGEELRREPPTYADVCADMKRAHDAEINAAKPACEASAESPSGKGGAAPNVEVVTLKKPRTAMQRKRALRRVK